MPTVISDSSTLIHLGGIGRLALLRELCGQIIIPPAVWREVVEEGKGRAGAAEVETAQKAGWIVLLPPTNEPLAFSLKRDLDEGEAEAIALALEHQADLILLDESEMRERQPKGTVSLGCTQCHQGRTAVVAALPPISPARWMQQPCRSAPAPSVFRWGAAEGPHPADRSPGRSTG